jgi:hypothetical protein
MGAPDSGAPDAGATDSKPGGGIGAPIGTPDPLSKYKWWILGGLALLLAAAAAFLLRKPTGASAVGASDAAAGSYSAPGSPATKQAALLNALKEELFALESEKIAGTLAPDEYAEVKAALDLLLRRALNRK